MCVYYMYVCNAFNAFVSSVGQSNSMMDLVDNKEEIAEKNLKDPNVNPMEIKRDLARRVVSLFYDDNAAEKAENYFNTIVVGKGVPDDIPEYSIKSEDLVINVIFNAGILKSKGEARRMVKQGAVKINGKSITDINTVIKPLKKQILKVGKRRFLKVIN